jgi:siroheme decarboxylase
MSELDNTDRLILNRIQSDFPITLQPFLTIAQELELDEEDVINRVRRLKKIGFIRRIGGNFVPEKLGFVSTLCAAKVPEYMIADFSDVVNLYSGVTHNYQRHGEFNVWFTFIAQSMSEIEENLEKISKQTGIANIINLPATKVFKIKAHFDL